ncbi:hypothetical protein UFOVP116_367 [uncultured Caudovirales phage]|uniref:Uncharacterized protein n=1 Tax=uncultured Caudovirales phage TaxID=2100421 RepID=A0A6J5L8F7_9CAUD|nr:hypothetical protein UFOVP116_367 [uncultured Caudovirales phage]
MSGAALNKLGIEVKRINKEQFLKVRNALEPVLTKAGLHTKFKSGWTMGSAGSWAPEHPYYNEKSLKTDAGDIDVMVDASELLGAFPPKSKTYKQEPAPEKKFADDLKSSKEQLGTWLTEQGFPNTGANLNMSFNLDGQEIQVDLIVKRDASQVIGGHQMDYSRDVGMKGSDLWLNIWPDLVRMTPNPRTGKTSLGVDPKTGKNISALQLSPDLGVVDRETGQVMIPWSNKDEIAKLMVGPHATGRDISSISGLRSSLQQVPNKWNAVKQYFPPINESAITGTGAWFKNILGKI